MKKLFFVSGIALLGLTTLNAQEVNQKDAKAQTSPVLKEKNARTAPVTQLEKRERTPEDVAKMKTARLDRIVNLDANQSKKVYEIYLKEAGNKADRAVVRKELQSEISSVLTPEQAKVLEEKNEKRKTEMKNRSKRPMMEKRSVRKAEVK